MKRLVYNEIKLFLSKKNIVITIIGIILMVLLFQFNYVKNYRQYPEFIPYILMIYTIIQFVCFISKNQMIFLIIPIIGLIVLSTNLFLPKESYIVGANIFLYMQTEKMFLGALGIGLPLAVVLLFVVSSVFIGLSIMVLNKREN